ncbi:MAG: ABC transporter ATP-binding protein [Nitrososphaerota archaeon]|nr:ABC transporter ATP-binding protein [Nitrososphaerota archaeon]
MGNDQNYLVEMRGIVKMFPTVVALNNVDFRVKKGEIHALLGENGAGKTTLMRILYGMYRPDEGEVFIEGRRVNISSPKDALKLGIGMVHQHFMLIDRLTVLENIALSLKGIKVSFKEIRNRIEELSSIYGLKINLDAKIWQLSVGEKQRVEILKTLYRDVKLLILDEPTSVLTPIESEELFKSLRKMVESGKSIILITHKIDEALNVSDSITVLRKGRIVASEIKRDEANRLDIVSMIVDRPIDFKPNRIKKDVSDSRIVMEVNNLRVLDDRGNIAVRDISFVLREGEILGIAGVAGNGQKELIEALTGLRRIENGYVKIFGIDVTNNPVGKMTSLGIAHIPEDRLRYGVALDLSVADNIIMKLYRKKFSRRFFLDEATIKKEAERLIQDFGIVVPSIWTPAGFLSGGNIQKLIVARELSMSPKILIASNPTSGLDVASTNYVHWALHRLRASGSSILLVSEDLDEILSLSDRILVMRDGKIVKEFKEESSINDIGLAMTLKET